MVASVPLHTRSISLRLRWGTPTEIVVEGRLMDIRKRAIVPLGASLRGPGIVHDMHIKVVVDTRSLCITRVEPQMLTFPYVASEHTGGEHCAGRIDDVQVVVGSKLDDTYVDGVRSQIGGGLGCFHIFTLLRLIGPAVVATLSSDQLKVRMSDDPPPVLGEILWARSLTVDSMKGEGWRYSYTGHKQIRSNAAGHRRWAAPKSSSAAWRSWRIWKTSFPSLDLDSFSGRRRALTAASEADEDWKPVSEFKELRGISVRKGYSAAVREALGDDSGLHPESHLAFMMAPVVMQSLPGFLEEMQIRSGSNGRESTATALGSCHMWRPGGPLERSLQPALSPESPNRKISK